jgi:glycosyltransferase involved in cell wall biosynthesis
MSTVDISIIIPVYNDPVGIRTTLYSLVQQNTSESYEILPVDNNSEDATGSVIASCETRYPSLVNGLEKNDVQGQFAALNHGIQHASGRLLCFMDADMYAPPHYLERASTFMRGPEKQYAGCNVEVVTGTSASIAAKYDALFGFDSAKYVQTYNFAGTGCLLTSKDLFEQVGGFDEKLVSSGDLEFGQRVCKAGIPQHFADHITLYHPARRYVSGHIKQRFRIGRGKYQMKCFYPEYHSGKTFTDALGDLLLNPFRFRRTCESRGILNRVSIAMMFVLSMIRRGAACLGVLYETVRMNRTYEERTQRG